MKAPFAAVSCTSVLGPPCIGDRQGQVVADARRRSRGGGPVTLIRALLHAHLSKECFPGWLGCIIEAQQAEVALAVGAVRTGVAQRVVVEGSRPGPASYCRVRLRDALALYVEADGIACASGRRTEFREPDLLVAVPAVNHHLPNLPRTLKPVRLSRLLWRQGGKSVWVQTQCSERLGRAIVVQTANKGDRVDSGAVHGVSCGCQTTRNDRR